MSVETEWTFFCYCWSSSGPYYTVSKSLLHISLHIHGNVQFLCLPNYCKTPDNITLHTLILCESPSFGETFIERSNVNTLATWCEELIHQKRPWCWERLKVGGEGDDRGWDGWMASPTPWTWVWVNSRSWRWIGRPGVLAKSQTRLSDWTTTNVIGSFILNVGMMPMGAKIGSWEPKKSWML